MATVTVNYTERLGTEFQVEVPDDVKPQEIDAWLQNHWDKVVEPNIQTHKLEVMGSDYTLMPDDDLKAAIGETLMKEVGESESDPNKWFIYFDEPSNEADLRGALIDLYVDQMEDDDYEAWMQDPDGYTEKAYIFELDERMGENIEEMPDYRCPKCGGEVSYDNASDDYFAACGICDEDFYRGELKLAGE